MDRVLGGGTEGFLNFLEGIWKVLEFFFGGFWKGGGSKDFFMVFCF